MTTVWKPGTTYLPGELVAPIITVSAAVAPIPNAGFESGDSDWDKGAGWAIDGSGPFVGLWSARHSGTGTSRLVQAADTAVQPGDRITAGVYYNQGNSPKLQNSARVILQWFDAGNVLLSESVGDAQVSTDAGPRWQAINASGIAPASAAFVRIAVEVEKDSAESVWVDSASWNFIPQAASLGFVYKAVQAEPGVSGTSEPAWPTTAGGTVVDNEVTWEAVATSRVVWMAKSRLRSGANEPDWPTVPGAVVIDGDMAWECISRRVEDERCPHGPYVAIVASKVYCADGDIIRYSATVNPLDWSSPDDAGYLPYGLQQFGANPITGLSIYRSNLVAFNSQGFQMWQVDEDPANSALLDSLPIGSSHHWALTPVSNDLFFLSDQGVRTIGIAASSTNLQAGDVGMPVDPIVQPAVQAAAARGVRPLGTYLPGDGQYWLTLPDANIVLIGNIPDGRVGDSYDELFYALRGMPPYVYDQASGSMPPGLSFDPETQRVTGTATTPGVFYVTLRATDSQERVALSPQVVTILGPPEEQLLSSLYPIVVVDSLDLGAGVEAGAFRQELIQNSQNDSLDIGVDVQEGLFRSMPAESFDEAIDVAVDLQAGTFKAMPVEDLGQESIDLGVTLQGGTFREMPYVDPIESVDLGVTLVGGVFSEE